MEKLQIWNGYECEVCAMSQTNYEDDYHDDDRVCSARKSVFTNCFIAAPKSKPCNACLNYDGKKKDTPELCKECKVAMPSKRKSEFGAINNIIKERFREEDHYLTMSEAAEVANLVAESYGA